MASVDLNHLRLFIAVCETGSFSRAAERLGRPRSTVSRGVLALEAELGVKLLVRNTRVVRLTPEGRSFAERAARGLLELDLALGSVRTLAEVTAGCVRISAPPDLAAAVLAPVVAAYVETHPQVSVVVSATTTSVNLVNEEFDFAIRASGQPLKTHGLLAQRIGTVRVDVYASPGYLQKAGWPKTPAELASHRWVVFQGPRILPSRARQLTEKPVPDARIVCDDMTVARQAAKSDGGLVALPRFLAASDVESGALIRALPFQPSREVGIYLLRPTGKRLPRRAAMFRDALLAYLREHPLR